MIVRESHASPGASTPPAGAEPQTTARSLRPVTLAALTAGLIALCALLAYPFLPAITWGIALAILAGPIHRAIHRRVEGPALSAALSTAVVVAIILVPGGFVAYQISREATAAAGRMEGNPVGATLQEQATRVPILGRAVARLEQLGVDVQQQARGAARRLLGDSTALAGGAAATILQALVATFLIYFLFRDRVKLMRGLRGLLPLSGEEADRVFSRAADSVHANLHATVITSVIDSVGFGLLFWWSGLPAPVLWTAVLFVLSLMPILGAAMVWIPATAYLTMSGRWAGAAGVVAWGALTFVAVDNFLYVRLAGERMRMHPVPALIAFLGGVAVFGASGMVLGPAIVAVTMAVLEVWNHRVEQPAAADPSRPL